ncbi:MAG TPA: magnesium transporter CorA family protein [Actinomycetes bacterium]|nr:magnesium transporter CorA family protein [Actinomycetes bacterium]
MDVHLITPEVVERRDPSELKDLLARPDAMVWVDIPSCDEHGSQVLSEVFGFHRRAVSDCVERNHVPKVHVYADHVFVVLHVPELGRGGHVHYIELDQFIGPNYLVTVHGPLNPAVAPEVALVETKAALRWLERGTLHPSSPFELSHTIVSALARRQADFVAGLARESGVLEKRVTLEEVSDDPEKFLDELFRVWYELLAVRTMGTMSREVYGRLCNVSTQAVPASARPLVADLADQFERVKGTADGQKEFLHGVIEYYQTRLHTQTTVAAERLAEVSVQQNDDMRKITAWVAIVAVPTAVTGFFGQNIPYPGFGDRTGFVISSTIMIVAALVLYTIFKHKRWL